MLATGHAAAQPHGVGAVAPGGQKDPAGQPAQVAFDAAPAAAEKVPPGQGVTVTEAHGQKEPGGQVTGAPEAQKKEAGQGVHVRARRLWAASSATTTTPAAVTVMPCGVVNDAAVPKPLAEPAVELPATVVTNPAGVTRRTRRLLPSATKTLPPAS